MKSISKKFQKFPGAFEKLMKKYKLDGTLITIYDIEKVIQDGLFLRVEFNFKYFEHPGCTGYRVSLNWYSREEVWGDLYTWKDSLITLEDAP